MRAAIWIDALFSCPQEEGHLLGDFALHFGQNVAVDPQGNLDPLVAKHFLDHMGLRAVLQGQGGACVPHTVEGNGSHA